MNRSGFTVTLTRTLALATALCSAPIALAQAPEAADAYPTRPIQLIVPFPPGGPTDIVARAIGSELTRSWKVPVVVQNRPGANSFIATEAVARAPGDGYSLLMAFFGTLVVNPSLYTSLPYDPVKDFAPVTTIASLPLMLVVPPASPIQTVKDLIELSRAQPNRFSFASGGIGQGAHLSGELLKSMTGIQMTHVAYKGNAPAVADLLGGHVDMLFDGMTSSLPHVRSGRLRAVAVSTTKRVAALPDVPTVDESGVPGFDVGSWFGLLAPASTPKAIVTRLNTEMVRIIESPEMQATLAAQGLDPMPSSPEAFTSFMKRESDKWARVVREAGIKAE